MDTITRYRLCSHRFEYNECSGCGLKLDPKDIANKTSPELMELALQQVEKLATRKDSGIDIVRDLEEKLATAHLAFFGNVHDLFKDCHDIIKSKGDHACRRQT